MKKIYIKRRLNIAFGIWNYDYKRNCYMLPNGQLITPECAEEMGSIIRKNDNLQIYSKEK